MKRTALILALATALVCFAGASAAQAYSVYYPGGGNPPATQISRNLSLKDAAQRGLVKLKAKGPGIEGDNVAMEVTNKRVRGPITVTVHAEFTVPDRIPQDAQDKIRSVTPEFERRVEAELNSRPYKTSKGDPIRFDADFRFRSPSEPPTPGYHQITIIDPAHDLDEPDPDFRSQFDATGEPNVVDSFSQGKFTTLTFAETNVLAHETLHLAGLADRYADFYRVGAKSYPLPRVAMKPSEVAAFARRHRPRLPAPPRGKVVSGDQPGTSPCDFMGTGENRDCRKISKRDLKFFENQAGIEVTAAPGDVLLNKDPSAQNYGVGFRTTVFAGPGHKTTAEGVSVFCIDHSLTVPETQSFDVIGPASQVPGFEPLGTLLALNGQKQLLLSLPTTGMLGAIWNVTDGTPIDNSPDPDEARAILNQAGIAENSFPSGLPELPDPNAGGADTAAVNQGEVIQTLPSKKTKPRATAAIQFARLFPSPLHAGGKVRGDLLLSLVGVADRLGIKLQRRSGGHWRNVRKLGRRKVKPGTRVLPLTLGRLRAGSYGLKLSAVNLHKVQSSRRVSFSVR